MRNLVKWWLGLAALVSFQTVVGQDIIVLNNEEAEELQVKIIEVSDESVKYKKWSYQDGPTFTLQADKIFVIKYQNGEKQRFVTDASTEYASQPRAKVAESADASESRETTVARERKAAAASQKTSKVRERKPAIAPSSQRTPAWVSKEPRNASVRAAKNFEPGIAGSATAGYLLGLGDYAADAINFLDVNLGYQFNPYFWLGGSVGNSFSYDSTPGFVSMMAMTRGFLPVGEKCAVYGEFGIGGGIGYSGSESNYLLRVGPGIKIYDVSVAALYNKFGEGSGGMLFQVGFHF